MSRAAPAPSLKAAIAANDLVRYLAQYAPGNTEPLRTDTKDWYDKLDEDKKALLKENWSGICATARQITDDPDEAKGVLESAGVSTDFSGVDLDAAAVGLDTVDGVLSRRQGCLLICIFSFRCPPVSGGRFFWLYGRVLRPEILRRQGRVAGAGRRALDKPVRSA